MNSSEPARTLLASARKASRSCARFRLGARGLFADEFRPLFRLPFYLLGLFEEIDEDRDFRPQDFRHHRREDVIDRA